MLAFKNNLAQMCETCQVQALLAPPPLLITSCTHSVTHSGADTFDNCQLASCLSNWTTVLVITPKTMSCVHCSQCDHNNHNCQLASCLSNWTTVAITFSCPMSCGHITANVITGNQRCLSNWTTVAVLVILNPP